LTLQQSVQIAIEQNPRRKAALADTAVASASAREARAALLPRLMFSETVTRSNDPVYVFGAKLRQRRFVSADFALNVLNTPAPFGNFATRFGATWNLFDSFASVRAIHQADRMQEAAGHQLNRTEQEIAFGVIDSYLGVLLALKRVEVAEAAVTAAESILEQSRNRFESGVSVESDLLSAQVRLAGRQQERIAARNGAALARARWNLSMGLAAEADTDPTEALEERNLPMQSLEEFEKKALSTRPDLERARAEGAAQEQRVAMARSAFGPRLSGFADWELDNPTFLAGNGGNNWLAGVELQLDLFQGGAKRAQLMRERAMQDKTVAARDAAADMVRLEVRKAYYDTDSARQQIGVAQAAVRQAEESLRIVQNRYDAGLTTISDLLNVEDAARRTRQDYWEAVYRYLTGYAGLELAGGVLGLQSPVVTR
jgi:outer membrane protein TolC